MKTRSKALLLTLCAVLLVTASVLGTMAFLTSNDEVVNTFSVGSVAIKLDEAKANTDGSLVEGAARVKANSYKLLPGHTYNKDPMVTVLNGSEASYIKMTVTFSKASALDAIFAPTGADLTSIFNGMGAALQIVVPRYFSKQYSKDTMLVYGFLVQRDCWRSHC